MSKPLLIARTLDTELFLLPGMANRHGLITGATGTGKTVTLQKLAESLSEIGVPVFMADVKGDLTGVAAEGTASEKLLARLKNIGVNDWQPHTNPVVVWDIFGEKGHPVRATVSDLIKFLGAEDIDNAFTVGIGAHPVFDIQHRLTKEVCCALLFQR
ncbi:helicase HerA-like domain-containing protein, partial [Escherichia coli]|uniref:helicase HerA-like domain-containing protein n=1 Tax=Escherichia coli TaxID=562 RepID=UPI00207BF8CA